MATVVKRVPHCELFDDGVIQLSGVRVSYPNWAVPYEGKNDKGEVKFTYGCVGMIPKTPEWDQARALIDEQIDKMLADHKVRIPADKRFMRDGDLTVKDEYAGHWTVHTNNDKAPYALHRLRDPHTNKPRKLDVKTEKDVIYGGCYCNMALKPWFQKNDNGTRVNANFVAIMFVKDGEPFGDGRISEDDAADRMNSYAEDDAGGGYGDTDSGAPTPPPVDPMAI